MTRVHFRWGDTGWRKSPPCTERGWRLRPGGCWPGTDSLVDKPRTKTKMVFDLQQRFIVFLPLVTQIQTVSCARKPIESVPSFETRREWCQYHGQWSAPHLSAPLSRVLRAISLWWSFFTSVLPLEYKWLFYQTTPITSFNVNNDPLSEITFQHC